MTFTPEDMITSLKKVGYEIREEYLIRETGQIYNTEEKLKVYNVYLHGNNMCEWGAAWMYRVEWVFNRELEKRLLKLF